VARPITRCAASSLLLGGHAQATTKRNYGRRGIDRDRSSPEDVRHLLDEWRRQIVREKAAVKQRRLLASSVQSASQHEIVVVTRIGRLRLQRKLGQQK